MPSKFMSNTVSDRVTQKAIELAELKLKWTEAWAIYYSRHGLDVGTIERRLENIIYLVYNPVRPSNNDAFPFAYISSFDYSDLSNIKFTMPNE